VPEGRTPMEMDGDHLALIKLIENGLMFFEYGLMFIEMSLMKTTRALIDNLDQAY
jgi:hypothetical protein